MRTLWQDVRYGFRMLARSPGFTAIVVVILAVGIGATTTMLSVIDAVLLRPPPYVDPKSLVYLYPGKATDDSYSDSASYLNVVDWRNQSTVFEHVAGITTAGYLTATTESRRERVLGLAVTPEYFPLLRIKPALGRVLVPQEAELGGAPVAIISHRFWQSWFGGDADVVGKPLVLNEKAYTVVGVLAADFRYADRGERDVWLPLVPFIGQDSVANRGGGYMWAMGRLKPGATMTQAQAEMRLIGHRLAEAYPDANAGTTVRVVSVLDEYRAGTGQSRRVLWMAQGIVAFVLLIACLHVGGLLLIRSVTREREIAVRAALGARRQRLIRQLLTEGVLLALSGGLLGLLFAYWALGVVAALRSGPSTWNPAQQIQRFIPWFVELRVDGRTLLYVIAVSLVTSAFFGILPAVLGSQTNLSRFLSSGRTPGHGLRFRRIQSALVILDIAIAFVLLIGTGLLVNTYVRLNTGLGYQPEKVLTAEIELDEGQPPYSQFEQRLAFYAQTLESIRHLPGVQCAAVADQTPAWGGGNFRRFRIDGFSPAQYSVQDDLRFPSLRWRQISSDYFRVLQIPLLKGRDFTEEERVGTSPVVIISESVARRFWPNEDPVGKYITEMSEYIRDLTEPRTQAGRKQAIPRQYQIVGVVGNARQYTWLKASPADFVVYASYAQTEWGGSLPVVLRTDSDPRSLIDPLRSAVLAMERNAEIRKITLLEDEIAELISPQRFNMLFLGVFAAVALALATVGVYGITAYAVSQRTQEIGIRIALGAESRDVLKAVLCQGLKITLTGVMIGLGSALAATRVIRSLLYDVSPTDPLTFACVALLLAAVALLASYFPARRAAKVDPMVALRCE